jgi:hypothetical protein
MVLPVGFVWGVITLTKLTQDVGQEGQADAGENSPLELAREIFRAWMRHWDYFADGAPASREVDAFLRAIIDCGNNLVQRGQEVDAPEVREKPQAKLN